MIWKKSLDARISLFSACNAAITYWGPITTAALFFIVLAGLIVFGSTHLTDSKLHKAISQTHNQPCAGPESRPFRSLGRGCQRREKRPRCVPGFKFGNDETS
jgi:hypothetical protein